MKKAFALLLIILVFIATLIGCNTPVDSTDTNKNSDVITTESEASEEASENTKVM